MYFERHDSRPSFVELRLSGDSIVSRFGRLGDAGLQSTKVADGPRALHRHAARLEKNGFWRGHHEPRLIRAIAAAPDEVKNYLVYADWLLERQDPRGSLIGAGADRAQGLLREHAAQLTPQWWAEAGFILSWRLGFVESMRVAQVSDVALLHRFFRHPSTIGLQTVRIGEVTTRDRAQWERLLPKVRVDSFIEA